MSTRKMIWLLQLGLFCFVCLSWLSLFQFFRWKLEATKSVRWTWPWCYLRVLWHALLRDPRPRLVGWIVWSPWETQSSQSFCYEQQLLYMCIYQFIYIYIYLLYIDYVYIYIYWLCLGFAGDYNMLGSFRGYRSPLWFDATMGVPRNKPVI